MSAVAKPKHVVLQEFVEIVFKHNPMKIRSPLPDEYEGEALSILSRFCEGALQVADNPEAIIQFAQETVVQTFRFWFADQVEIANLEPVTMALLKAYLDSFPDQVAPKPKKKRAKKEEETTE